MSEQGRLLAECDLYEDYKNPFDEEREKDPECGVDTEWVATQLALLEGMGEFPQRNGRWSMDDRGNLVYEPSVDEIKAICELIQRLRRERAEKRARAA